MVISSYRLTITDIVVDTVDVYTYVFYPVVVAYQPGQFLTLLVQIDGQEVRRSYSITSAPTVAGELVEQPLAITIKRVENGWVSRYLIDHLRIGDVVDSLPPAGRFTLPTTTEPRDVVLIGAGSGITPLFSILIYTLNHEPTARVTLLDVNTSEKTIIYRAALDALQQQYPDRFQLIHLLSQPTDAWAGRRGRLNNLLLERLLPDLTRGPAAAALWFLCGPPDFMRMVRFTLTYLGIPPQQIRRELFVTEPVNVPSAARFVVPDRIIQLRFRGEIYSLLVPSGSTVLQAALAAGIALPYSCRGGRCATCAGVCRNGRVQMSINDVLTERDLAEGWVLTCTAYPETDGIFIEV
ncbi:2Fe-2S iron-sulfur cluster-binding protein [Fibrella sp. WM1]|uniref:2Fe-2S iron-sulfur cluster-binding protein n=1 Tax=Fibrella musci TaxID=3242485 RepID=UPI00352186BE